MFLHHLIPRYSHDPFIYKGDSLREGKLPPEGESRLESFDSNDKFLPLNQNERL